MAAWQTIETAPKDRTVLLYSSATGEAQTATWMTSIEEGDGAWVIVRHLSPTNPIAFVFRHPTHWQPLPAPPSDTNQGTP
jgi:hypothetical protein